jgi:hypothetical protein
MPWIKYAYKLETGISVIFLITKKESGSEICTQKTLEAGKINLEEGSSKRKIAMELGTDE